MKRPPTTVTTAQLERLADEHHKQIEFTATQGFLTIGGQRYVADLEVVGTERDIDRIVAAARADERERWAPADEEPEDRDNRVKAWTEGYLAGQHDVLHDAVRDNPYRPGKPPARSEEADRG